MSKPTPEHKNPVPIANLGDVNFLAYDGTLLFAGDEPDTHRGEHVRCPEGDLDAESRWTVYCFDLERFQAIRDYDGRPIIVGAEWEPDDGKPEAHAEWFSSELQQIARYNDCGVEDLAQCLTSKDPVERLFAYDCIAGLYGWDCFDSEPLKLTQHEAYSRYNELDDCDCEGCEVAREWAERAAVADAIDAEIEARWARGEEKP